MNLIVPTDEKNSKTECGDCISSRLISISSSLPSICFLLAISDIPHFKSVWKVYPGVSLLSETSYFLAASARTSSGTSFSIMSLAMIFLSTGCEVRV